MHLPWGAVIPFRVNFNVYLDDETARRLDALARETGSPRNAIIRHAVAAWLDRVPSAWPELVRGFTGDPALAPFESLRDELRSPDDDPFAASRANDRPRGRRR